MAALLSQDGFWGFYFFKAHHINIFLMCYLTGETAHVFYFSLFFLKNFIFSFFVLNSCSILIGRRGIIYSYCDGINLLYPDRETNATMFSFLVIQSLL